MQTLLERLKAVHILAIPMLMGGAVARLVMSRPGGPGSKQDRDALSLLIVQRVEFKGAVLAVITGFAMYISYMKLGLREGWMHAKAGIGLLMFAIAMSELSLAKKAVKLRSVGDDAGADKKSRASRSHAVMILGFGLAAIVLAVFRFF